MVRSTPSILTYKMSEVQSPTSGFDLTAEGSKSKGKKPSFIQIPKTNNFMSPPSITPKFKNATVVQPAATQKKIPKKTKKNKKKKDTAKSSGVNNKSTV